MQYKWLLFSVLIFYIKDFHVEITSTGIYVMQSLNFPCASQLNRIFALLDEFLTFFSVFHYFYL